MSNINWVRVVVAGLVAGLVINISGFVMAHFVLGREYIVEFKSKMPPRSDMHMFAKHLSLRFWFGLVAMILYAAFGPCFGSGPLAVIIAGGTVFLTAGLVMLLTVSDLGLLSGRRLWIAAIWSLAEIILATLIGAWLYREAVVVL